MKFKYTGEAPNGLIEQYGATFVPGGEAVEIVDPWAQRKLLGNRFFERVDDSKPVTNEEGAPVKRRARAIPVQQQEDET